jgi:hypothetical protein
MPTRVAKGVLGAVKRKLPIKTNVAARKSACAKKMKTARPAVQLAKTAVARKKMTSDGQMRRRLRAKKKRPAMLRKRSAGNDAKSVSAKRTVTRLGMPSSVTHPAHARSGAGRPISRRLIQSDQKQNGASQVTARTMLSTRARIAASPRTKIRIPK